VALLPAGRATKAVARFKVGRSPLISLSGVALDSYWPGRRETIRNPCCSRFGQPVIKFHNGESSRALAREIADGSPRPPTKSTARTCKANLFTISAVVRKSLPPVPSSRSTTNWESKVERCGPLEISAEISAPNLIPAGILPRLQKIVHTMV
jgi:hypothetical protein